MENIEKISAKQLQEEYERLSEQAKTFIGLSRKTYACTSLIKRMNFIDEELSMREQCRKLLSNVKKQLRFHTTHKREKHLRIFINRLQNAGVTDKLIKPFRKEYGALLIARKQRRNEAAN